MASLTFRRGTLRVDTLRGPDVLAKAGSDTGAGSDSQFPVLVVLISGSDVGVGNDGGPAADVLSDTDASSSVEDAVTLVVISAIDAGVGSDAGAQNAVADIDFGSAIDNAFLVDSLLDTCVGVEGVAKIAFTASGDHNNGVLERRHLDHHGSSIYVGGLRARLIRDSLFNMVKQGLTDLEWFDSDRQHAPINWRESEVLTTEEIPLNTIALSDADTHTLDWELGSDMAEHNWVFFIDFYAEDSAVGIHMIRDVKDLLEGRFPSIGRIAPVFTVYDYTLTGNPAIFICEIENVDVDKAHVYSKPWQRHWYAISLTVVDYYGNEGDVAEAEPPQFIAP